MYTAEEEMLNKHNGDVPPRPVLLVVGEPETNLVRRAVVLSRLGEFTLGGPRIFVHAPQYRWHSVASAGADAKARERLVALERNVFTFGK